MSDEGKMDHNRETLWGAIVLAALLYGFAWLVDIYACGCAPVAGCLGC